MALPETAETLVTLACPSNKDDDESKWEPVKLSLVHVLDPKTSTFSQTKKQCDLWEYVWGSSLLLGGMLSLIDMKELQAIEIGGGQGLCSIAAAKSGAEVLMTDLVLDATKLAEKSAKKNGVEERISFKSLDWNKAETVPDEAFDVVIGSDVLFYRGTVRPVAKCMFKTLRPGGVALLADPCRLNVDDFVDKVEELGMTTKLFLFKKEVLQESKNLRPKDDAFVEVKRGKLVVMRKPFGASGNEEQYEKANTFYEKFMALIPLFADEP
mmetsp:Transcript_2941/g.3357  ORF Transcript_2941/g.3357 Transcript_2941/m.3357 type:complete len:268 (+) Transcript_2941:67-870(+)